MTETTPALDASSRAARPLPEAVLWDMDGTLVDTEPYWQESQVRLVAEHGGTWSREDGDSLIGSGLWHSAKVLQDHGVALDGQAIIDYMTDDVLRDIRSHLPWRPGARELLRELRDAGVKTALVTMSFRRMAEEIADAIEFDAFDLVVAGDMVEHAKPHPEAYLVAAERLGVDITRCVAIEDSPTGAAAAVASGAVTIAVEHHAPLPADGGFLRRDTLTGVTLDDLREILESGRELAALPEGEE
ncbi:HAD family hydrolase [Frondihabitans australicus]|uniref:HAD superfamily hydrolase (TIGR01509 family) n=1 Tax=Frondihabitans australicus TaxID=386892 RepID=A0A495IGM4_9MICO|nr:HAD family phosphatase [Frondihabitans australicus]RKR74236.1 HAD superfamily hydrolase (TIGR01509 family) [Frondihabitans australicus]